MPDVNIVLNPAPVLAPMPSVGLRQSTRITQAQKTLRRKKNSIQRRITNLIDKLLPLRNELTRLNDKIDSTFTRYTEEGEKVYSVTQRIRQERMRRLAEQQQGNIGLEYLTARQNYDEHRVNAPDDRDEIIRRYDTQSGLNSRMIAEAERSVQDLLAQKTQAEQEQRKAYASYHESVSQRDSALEQIPELQHKLGVLERIKNRLNRIRLLGRGRKIKMNVSRKKGKKAKSKRT